MSDLVDSGWAAFLPFELLDALDALHGGAAPRRALRDRLARPPDAEAVARWDRFALVAPSRIDLPPSADGLSEQDVYELLDRLGLVTGRPPRAVATPDPVELVLTLDHEQQRELEALRAARFGAPDALTPLDALPSLEATFGSDVGRNDPCPCGSGKKFKKCHGR